MNNKIFDGNKLFVRLKALIKVSVKCKQKLS